MDPHVAFDDFGMPLDSILDKQWLQTLVDVVVSEYLGPLTDHAVFIDGDITCDVNACPGTDMGQFVDGVGPTVFIGVRVVEDSTDQFFSYHLESSPLRDSLQTSFRQHRVLAIPLHDQCDLCSGPSPNRL